MAIKRIRELPNQLPYALLYLDDLEEIQKILIDACTVSEKTIQARYPSLSDHNVEIKAAYKIGDLRMDSMDDLVEYGQPTSDFKLEIIANGRRIVAGLEFSVLANPVLHLSLEGDADWSVYAQVKAIFDRRQLRFKNSILTWPEWLRLVFYVLIMFAAPFIPLMVHFPSRLYLYVGLAILVSMVYYAMFRPSRVFFVRSHERSRLSASVRREYIKVFVLLVVGGVLAKLIDFLFAHFKH
jgi:hypothetical protein